MDLFTPKPNLDSIQSKHLLIQAWKKTSDHIRSHSWYVDTFDLDLHTINLPKFIETVAARLKSPTSWVSRPLRLIPAPKSQQWSFSGNPQLWKPNRKEPVDLRPLAYVHMEDQVVATAISLCLADRVETRQGDPRQPATNIAFRKSMTSYGNRLFCDRNGDLLTHRWGSGKLYRKYFQDYKAFIDRPTDVINRINDQTKRLFLIQTDLSQFYDRVRPGRLAKCLNRFKRVSDDPAFYCLASKVLNWEWKEEDRPDAETYGCKNDISDFANIALPQGLVASGFFSNMVLNEFDETIQASIGEEIDGGLTLEDSCRYVDDMRFVVSSEDRDLSIDEVKCVVEKWIKHQLSETASEHQLNDGKTEIFENEKKESPLVLQSPLMNRVQKAISGGFNSTGGLEILDALQSLITSQKTLNASDDDWRFRPKSDVKDATLDRFTATRFRSVYRSTRPLLYDVTTSESDSTLAPSSTINQKELDTKARAFALLLISKWFADPSNIRLLRIGLDIYPDATVLQEVIESLKQYTGGSYDSETETWSQVAWYCYSEILRAGATETGLVDDQEQLQDDIDLNRYRDILADEAQRLLEGSVDLLPWYLRQQALLFLIATHKTLTPNTKRKLEESVEGELKNYLEVYRFLNGEYEDVCSENFAIFSILGRRAFHDNYDVTKDIRPFLDQHKKHNILVRDPAFIVELGDGDDLFYQDIPKDYQKGLGRTTRPSAKHLPSLASLVANTPSGDFSFRNELTILRFAKCYLQALSKQLNLTPRVLFPCNVLVAVKNDEIVSDIKKVTQS